MNRLASPEGLRRALSKRRIATGVYFSPPPWHWTELEPEEKALA